MPSRLGSSSGNRLVALAALALVAAAACSGLKIPDGKLKCSAKKECPSGLECRADGLCWVKGHGDGGPRPDGNVDGSNKDLGRAEVGVDGGGSPGDDGGPDGFSPSPCPALTNPEGGVVSVPAVIDGAMATYSCNLGYTLTGAADRTCQTDGTWSGAAPTCTIKDCGPLMAPASGSVDATVTTFGAVATYSCGAGMAPSGSATRRCQLDGKWDGMQPTCVVANCPALPGPMNGSVVALPTFGSTATYACDSGYVLTGSTTRTCKTDGTWSDAAPTCTVKNCGALTAPSNGKVNATGAAYGATGTYSCDAGYTLSGAATVMCQTDGTWSASAPTCALKDCGPLTMPANGSVNAAVTTFGSTATYACGTGYVAVGATTRMCGATGAWSGAAPTCMLKDCGALTAPANGAVDAKVTTFGATATYSCATGYGPSGSATRTCTLAGWDGTAPTCVIANCPSLASPTGGTVAAPALTFGAMATYACNTGYDIAGAATRTCQASGAWSGMAPTCTIKNCGALTMPTNGAVAATVTTYGATATYSCVTGYGLAGTGTRTCQADGMWSGTAPTCAIKNCGALGGPTNGAVVTTPTNTTTYGATATYSCNTGYGLTAAATRTCQADATWSGAAPACAIKDCGVLANPVNGTVSAPTTTYGSTATYSCALGYGPSGSSTRTCQAAGTWSGTAPTCVIANCPALQNPTGGTVSAPTLTYGSMATYACNNGYELVGTTMRTCQANGQWTGAAATCAATDCGAPPTPAHGSVTASTTTYGASATYACDMGYTLSGATTRTCQANGTWSSSLPSCVAVDCGPPAAIANGSPTYSATVYPSTAQYMCNLYYMLSSGTGIVSCLASKAWSTPTPSCVDICTGGGAGTSAHCCNSTACSGSTPVCNTTSHKCEPKTNGTTCSSSTECGSGYCVGNKCCNNACAGSGTCASCSTGTCVPYARRTPCGVTYSDPYGYSLDYAIVSQYCDGVGEGTCVWPTFKCGTQTASCTVNQGTACCSTSVGNTEAACVSRTSCYHDNNVAHEGCKDSLDCPNNKTCCQISNYGFRYQVCLADCTVMANGRPACNFGGTSTCPAGTTCHDAFYGEGACY